MGRSLSVVNTSVTNDPVYVTAAENIAANSLVTYNNANQLTGMATSSSLTVRGPKALGSVVDTTLRINNSSDGRAVLSTDVLTNGNIVVGYSNSNNSSRASVAVLTPAGAVAVAPIQLSTSAPDIIKVQSLSGGGFAVAYMNGDGTVIAVYQNDGTQVLAPVQISATATGTTMGLRMCRAMTDGTGFAVLWSETGSTTLRVYNASGTQQATSTLGTYAAASAMYGQDKRFDMIRHPSNGNLYVAYYNATTTTGSAVNFVGLSCFNPQTLGGVFSSPGNEFILTLNSMTTPFTGITIVPGSASITLFAGFRRTFGTGAYAANLVKSFNLSGGSSDATPICFGDGGYMADATQQGQVGHLANAVLSHTTGESCFMSVESTTIRLLHFMPTAAFAFERDTGTAGAASRPNASVCGSGSNVYLLYPAGSAAANNLNFRAYSTATEVVSVTASYNSLGLAAGLSAGTYSAPSGIHSSMLAGFDATDFVATSHRLSADVAGVRYYTTRSCTSAHNGTSWPWKYSYNAVIVACHADGSSGFSAHLLPRNMVFTTKGEANNPYASHLPQIQFVNGYLVNLAIERESAINVVYGTIIRLSDWTVTGRMIASRNSGTSCSYYDSVVTTSGALYVASAETTTLRDRVGEISSSGTYASSLTQDGGTMTNATWLSVCATRDRFAAVLTSGNGAGAGAVAYILRNNSTYAVVTSTNESSITNISTGTENPPRLLPRNETTFWFLSVTSTNAYYGVLGSLASTTLTSIGGGSASQRIVIRHTPTPDWGSAFSIIDSSNNLQLFRWTSAAASASIGSRVIGSSSLLGGGFSRDGSVAFTTSGLSGFATASGNTPLVAGVVTTAATANQTTTVSRTGVYQLNASYQPVSFNFKRGNPPGAKGQIMGSTAILDSSKTNIA